MELKSLNKSNSKFFLEQGYLVMPSLINKNISLEISKALEDKGTGSFDMQSTIKTNSVINIIFNKKLNAILKLLFNSSEYTLHHITSALHTTQTPNLSWHHDKVTTYSKKKQGLMIHALIYPSGMNKEIGELLLIPQSHAWNVDRYQLSNIPLDAFESQSISTLPYGSVVFINSSLIHARRSLPCNSTYSRRHFIDVSFCQNQLKWEPYLESNISWRKSFDLIGKGCKEKQSIHTKLLDKKPYEIPLLIKYLPFSIQRKYYLLRSFIYRRLYSTKSSKSEF